MTTFRHFSAQARAALHIADAEARSLGYAQVGPGQLLLGLIGEPDGAASEALATAGVTLGDARNRLIAITAPSDAGPITGRVPFTPACQRILESAMRDTASRGADTIGTGSLLRALLDDGESDAVTILDGITGVAAVRTELAAIATVRDG
jgi:ATP-dependent Clp protease ATP-binding subunit ClpA